MKLEKVFRFYNSLFSASLSISSNWAKHSFFVFGLISITHNLFFKRISFVVNVAQ